MSELSEQSAEAVRTKIVRDFSASAFTLFGKSGVAVGGAMSLPTRGDWRLSPET